MAFRVIYIHAHYFPETYLDLVADEGKRFDASYRMTDKGWFIKTPAASNGPLSPKFIDLKARIADMDQQGVARNKPSRLPVRCFIGATPISPASLPRPGTMRQRLRTEPIPLALSPSCRCFIPDRALDELDRARKLPGMRGVYMGTNIEGHDLEDPLFEPILARIEALDLPIFLHPLETIGGDRLKPFFLSRICWATPSTRLSPPAA